MTEPSVAASEPGDRAEQLALIKACVQRAMQCDAQDILPIIEEGLERAHALNPCCFAQADGDLSETVMDLFRCGIRLMDFGQREQCFQLLQSAVVVAGRWLNLSSVDSALFILLAILSDEFGAELENAPELMNACAALIRTYGGGHPSQALIDALPPQVRREKPMLAQVPFLLYRHRLQERSEALSNAEILDYLRSFDKFLCAVINSNGITSYGIESNPSLQHYRQLCLSEFKHIAQHIPLPTDAMQADHLSSILWLIIRIDPHYDPDQLLEPAMLLKRHLLAGVSLYRESGHTAQALSVIASVVKKLRDDGGDASDIVTWTDAGVAAALRYSYPDQWFTGTGNYGRRFDYNEGVLMPRIAYLGAELAYVRLELSQNVPIGSGMLADILDAAGRILGASLTENGKIDPTECFQAHINWLAMLERLRRKDMVDPAAYAAGKNAVIDQVARHQYPDFLGCSTKLILPAYQEVGWGPISSGQVFGDILSRTAELACADGQDNTAPDELFLSCLELGFRKQSHTGPEFPASRLRRCLDLWKN